tara:strand:+ start:1250 stop:1552 length:303 start_codon:yes stop_codon:yes gene_type:complete
MSNNQLENNEKPFTEISYTFLVLIFISIIASISIAMMADMPDSIGFGGFVYLIGPLLIGIVILVLYISMLFFKPKWKTILGTVAIIINICVGLYFMIAVH